MRKITILFILLITWITGFSQTEKEAEKSALNCINKTLAIADKDFKYIIASSIEQENCLFNMDMESFKKKINEFDSILSKCGLYKSKHLDINLLKDCMLSSYDLKDEKNDTTSAYYQLLSQLITWSDNPTLFKETSPYTNTNIINSIITSNNRGNDFYNVMRFILHQGIIKEFDNYAKSMKDIKIRDDVEIEEELTLVAPIKTDFPCGEEIFVIVDKMPEYKGGKEAEKNYLSVKSSGIKGIVYVQFIIDCQGKVTTPKIVRGLDPSADKVALELVKAMPDWIPGEQEGKKVNVQSTYAVSFEL